MNVKVLRELVSELGGDVSHMTDEQVEEQAQLFVTNTMRTVAFAMRAYAAFTSQLYDLGVLEDEEETD